MNSEKMVRLARRQNPAAVAQLTTFMWRIVVGVCTRYLEEADREEHMHMILISIFDLLPKFEYHSDPQLEAYIGKKAFGHCMDFLKAKKTAFALFIIDEHDLIDETDEFEMTAEHYQQMLYEVDQLPIGYRTIFKLKVFEQMTYPNIAILLEIMETTCRSQYHRAKNQLKVNLIKNGFYNGTES